MECKIVEAVVKDQLDHLEIVKQYTNLIPHAQQLETLMRRWQGFNVRISTYDPHTLIINANLDLIKDIEPLLEFLEIGLNIDFNNSRDVAQPYATYRTFNAVECPWLRVDANLKADGPGCRKIQVGMTKPQPIYEIRCLAEVDAPLAIEGASSQLPAPAPALSGPLDDDDIPF